MTVAAACVACDSAVTPALLAYVGTSANGSKPSPKPLPKPLGKGKGTGYLGGGKGGTADYLDSDDNSETDSPRLAKPDPPPVSSKARMGSPLAAPKPLPAVKLTGPSLRERKPAAVPKAEVPPVALKVTSKTKKEPKAPAPEAPEPAAGAKRKYTFGPVAIAAQEARRAAKQMKALTSGANAPAFDISGDVKILPSQSGECLLASLPLVARPLTCPRPRRRGMEAEAHAPRGRDRPAQVGRR